LPASTAPADFRPNDQLRRHATALSPHVTMSHAPLQRHSRSKIVLGRTVPDAVWPELHSGHSLLQLQEHHLRERFGSRPIHLIFLEVSAEAHFHKIVRLSAFRMICRSGPLPWSPRGVPPKLPKRRGIAVSPGRGACHQSREARRSGEDARDPRRIVRSARSRERALPRLSRHHPPT
jgi:hypothetical protein